MNSYLSFKETHPVFSQLKSKEISNVDLFSIPSKEKKHETQLRNTLVRHLTSMASIATQSADINVDPFELQVCKIMMDGILEQLKSGGAAEAEIVKKYKFQKINGLRIDGAAETEVNEMLKNAITSVFGESEIADEVIIPALLQ